MHKPCFRVDIRFLVHINDGMNNTINITCIIWHEYGSVVSIGASYEDTIYFKYKV